MGGDRQQTSFDGRRQVRAGLGADRRWIVLGRASERRGPGALRSCEILEVALDGPPGSLRPDDQLAVRVAAALRRQDRGDVGQRPGRGRPARRAARSRTPPTPRRRCARPGRRALRPGCAGSASAISLRRRRAGRPAAPGRSHRRCRSGPPRWAANARESRDRRWTRRAGGRPGCRCPRRRRKARRAGRACACRTSCRGGHGTAATRRSRPGSPRAVRPCRRSRSSRSLGRSPWPAGTARCWSARSGAQRRAGAGPGSCPEEGCGRPVRRTSRRTATSGDR